VIVYTGHGGRDSSGRQVADQEWRRGNLALLLNETEGLPVRVVRGAGGDPAHSPTTGYRYEGPYFVERAWQETGKEGFLMCRFLLRALNEDGTPVEAPAEFLSPPKADGEPARRIEATVQRLVRNTMISQYIKNLHKHRCQICGHTLTVAAGPYAEGAHVRPLGRPHNGSDVASNILCLCPNDHVLFDLGAIVVEDDLTIRDTRTGEKRGVLRSARGHTVDIAALRYHRERLAALPT
jgi:putative restriction endonuclease